WWKSCCKRSVICHPPTAQCIAYMMTISQF
ncbi:GGDEF domain protein, partial [Vibrio parahaemolyticus V-223/04]